MIFIKQFLRLNRLNALQELHTPCFTTGSSPSSLSSPSSRIEIEQEFHHQSFRFYKTTARWRNNLKKPVPNKTSYANLHSLALKTKRPGALKPQIPAERSMAHFFGPFIGTNLATLDFFSLFYYSDFIQWKKRCCAKVSI